LSDIFKEVEEDLRADRMNALLKRYGGALVGVAVLCVAGAGGWEVWKWRSAKEATRIATIYSAAARAADDPAGTERAAARADLAQVIAEGNPAYRSLARLRTAALAADAGERDVALSLWDTVAGDSAADPLLRDVARLQWAMHQLDAGEPAQIEAHLAPLTAPGNALRPLAEEAQALLALRQGNRDAARDTLRRLAQDVTAPEGVRGRANGLLAQIGG
jgi:hypothetical protein